MSFFQAGAKNLITDIDGIRVGNAADLVQRTGVTVLVPDEPAVCAVDVRGGGPGTRETDLLKSQSTVQHIHALVLSGGSAFGLEAASEIQMCLARDGKGFDVANGAARVPIVPQAILFDLLNGGYKPWTKGEGELPYRNLAKLAYAGKAQYIELGKVGAGAGATTADGEGGLGSASTIVDKRFSVGALVAVNALGSVKVGDTGFYHAAAFEMNEEFGGFGVAPFGDVFLSRPKIKGSEPAQNTSIAIIATDLKLDRPALQRIAAMAHDGLARAIWPVHAPLDGDTIFVISTGRVDPENELLDVTYAGQAAAQTLARAVARGVYEVKDQKKFSLPIYIEKVPVADHSENPITLEDTIRFAIINRLEDCVFSIFGNELIFRKPMPKEFQRLGKFERISFDDLKEFEEFISQIVDGIVIIESSDEDSLNNEPILAIEIYDGIYWEIGGEMKKKFIDENTLKIRSSEKPQKSTSF